MYLSDFMRFSDFSSQLTNHVDITGYHGDEASTRIDQFTQGHRVGLCQGKSGQYINLNYAKCGFSGLKFSAPCRVRDIKRDAPIADFPTETRTSAAF